MKYKRDYKIEIGADNTDICFWKGTHKGDLLKDAEDYEMVLSMLEEITGYVKRAIALNKKLHS